jgi:6-phosphogluconate dehydrogenase
MIIIVMGVSGSGKTTIGKALAERAGFHFYDGDDFHSKENISKMAEGIPLTDENRMTWLQALAETIRNDNQNHKNSVIACSALKEKYRKILRIDNEGVKFVYLRGTFDLIHSRMQARSSHYMKPDMLKSQFEILEEPEDALVEDITLAPEEIVEDILEKLIETKYQVGIVGLGVMGRNLALNFRQNGYRVIGYDIAPNLPPDYPVRIANSVKTFVSLLEEPRIILMMVPAGRPVDQAIRELIPELLPGDILIDGGNSYFMDTERRIKKLKKHNIHYIGMGISGGECGALNGPCFMPGGDEITWDKISPLFKAIAAKTTTGTPCVEWMGEGGAGHYVKMIHNGIEYADMQLIAEVYDLLHRGAGIPNEKLSDIFFQWNQGVLQSYLIEITAKILRNRDHETGQSLIDLIVDEAVQKGTGKWASQNSFDLGIGIPTINAAVESRFLSSRKAERFHASRVLGGISQYTGDTDRLIEDAESALYVSKITSYAQGLSLLQFASAQYNWGVEPARVVGAWQAGCIIRASFLQEISSAFIHHPQLPNLMMDEVFVDILNGRQKAWREVVKTGVDIGIPMLAMGASLAYFDTVRAEQLPANLIQAQRDFFGAHGYKRVDCEKKFHNQWE